MALKLKKSTNQGFDLDYHMIAEIAINWYTNQAEMIVYSFYSREERMRESAVPVKIQNFDFGFGFEQPLIFTKDGDHLKQGYDWLKSNPFKNSTDI